MAIRKPVALALAGISMLAASPAAALVIFTSNFDDHVVDVDPSNPGSGSGYDFLDSIDGWTKALNPIPPANLDPFQPRPIEVQNGIAGTAHTLQNLVELDSNFNAAMDRVIGQGTYRLTYFYSPRPFIDPTSNGISVLLDDIVIDTATGPGGTNTVWTQRDVFFTVGTSANLKFAALGTPDSLGGYIDTVTLQAVPEPSTWAMMLIGFGAVGYAFRRRPKYRLAQAV